MPAKSNGVAGDILGLLSAADKRHGFPEGTMAAIMQQEVGGKADQYLADPTKYHYEAGPDGRRIAPSTGKVSTAFGPFGLLESTAAAPGYGVKPLADKSLEEQIRFASDYLAARSKGGGLAAGLAGYGEGAKYAQQVAGRAGVDLASAGAPASQAPPPATPGAPAAVVVAQAPVAAPQDYRQLAQGVQSQGGAEAWAEFLRKVAPAQRAPVPEDFNYGPAGPGAQGAPVQLAVSPMQNLRPNFQAFGAWGGRTA